MNVRLSTFISALLLVSCSTHEVRRYPLSEPVWEDPDRNAVPERAGKYYSGLIADGADQTFFLPVSRMFTFPRPGESVNVNSIDEVPNSSWFTNRIGFFDVSPERAARGACGDTPDLDPNKGPWLVTAAKPNGANPGFFIKAADGFSYLLKFDGPQQPTRGTGSDVLGSKVYWAAGYNTPCNHIVFFDKSILKVAEDATAENIYGEDEPISQDDVDTVLKMAFRTKEGMMRASASRFVPGKPLGPFKYQDTRGDDPNDVIPHEDRRELRAARILAAWLNHFDSREQNSLDVWMNDNGKEYIRHYYIDWGDSLGGRWPLDQVSRRLGRSYYLDFEHVGEDLVSLGLISRSWNEVNLNRFEIFGYLDTDSFVPSEWRAGYPNPAFDRMTFRDALWMIRIMDKFTDEHIRAWVETAHFPDPRQSDFITDVLIKRRDKIFEEYLTQYASLAHFRLARRTKGRPEQSLCFEDLAIKHKVADPNKVFYKMRFYAGENLDDQLGWLQFTPDPDHPHRSCIVLPVGHLRPSDLAPKGAPDNHPLRYGILRIFIHQDATVPPLSSIDIHLYDLGPERGMRIAGIDRPPEPVKPDLY